MAAKAEVVAEVGKQQLIEGLKKVVYSCRPGELAIYDAEVLEGLAKEIRERLREAEDALNSRPARVA